MSWLWAVLCSVLVLHCVGLSESSGKVKMNTNDDPLELLSSWRFWCASSLSRTLVSFVVPWCSACRTFDAVWRDLESLAQSERQVERIELVQVDCSLHNEVACRNAFNIQTYPTIQVFEGGRVSTYSGQRDARHVLNWARSVHLQDDFIAGKLGPLRNAPSIIVEYAEWSAYDVARDLGAPVFHVGDSDAAYLSRGVWLLHAHIRSKFDRAVISPLIAAMGRSESFLAGLVVADMLVHDQLAEEFGITAFPTILVFEVRIRFCRIFFFLS